MPSRRPTASKLHPIRQPLSRRRYQKTWSCRGPLISCERKRGSGPGDLASGLDASLLTAIWRLPRRQREVIALRIFLDLDTATIARQLGIEAGTVRMHLSRGVTALRHELTPTTNMEAGQ